MGTGSGAHVYTVLSKLVVSTSPTVNGGWLSRFPTAVGSFILHTRSELLTWTRHLACAKLTARNTADKQVIAKAYNQIVLPAGIQAMTSWETSLSQAR